MIDLFKSSYTCFLERENADLKEEKRVLEARNHELVMALFNKNLTLPELIPPKTEHKIEKKNEDTMAICSCGWFHSSDDPGTLQMAITEHYRKNVVKPGAKRWVQTRNAAEKAAENEALQQEGKIQ